ncbi:MAG: hypothetical protein K0U74_07765 [Alphaproteobacteria bacterium]|nr:hypothetical protein [Alphaproteobacteria bacterium]
MATAIHHLRSFIFYLGVLATLAVLTYAGGLKVLMMTGEAVAGAPPAVQIATIVGKAVRNEKRNGNDVTVFSLELAAIGRLGRPTQLTKPVSKSQYERFSVGDKVKLRRH